MMFYCHFNHENGLHLVIVCARFQAAIPLKKVEVFLTVTLSDVKREILASFIDISRNYAMLVSLHKTSTERKMCLGKKMF